MERELRLLVTQDCNYRCKICHGEGLQTRKIGNLTPEDFVFLFKTGQEFFGINTTTLTGGEPLVRTDIVSIAQQLNEGGAKVTLTTNGNLLSERTGMGRYLDKVNVSVHSTDLAKYDELTRVKGSFDQARTALFSFRQEYPNIPIILNSTCIDGFNSSTEDIQHLIDLARGLRASVKFIELFPVTDPRCIKLEKLQKGLSELGFTQITHNLRRKILSDGTTKVTLTRIFCSEAIETDHHSVFCHENNDLFVSPDGQIKPCRNDISEIDLSIALMARDKHLLADNIRQSFDLLGCRCIYE